ncbi:chromosome partitioning protein ParB [Treponema rectale]|uniref:Chromosome partitioning protein ParB n=1 Tax=Treponema rectale TaxID=744512 RepID=A0A840SF45_9SPIR|nr:ParB N-terminal domain-containing protein [Treponema rectale]MBB5218072.1 ParB family chromosome partitioning protein [Treponema rectale]QOS40214.1 chromosome partitioning protein ParB [Treponema rectale]
MLIKISDVKVKKRVRKDLGDLSSLKDSLRSFGLLNPITINSNHELIAGERRLEAAKAIGWESINAIVIASPIDKVHQLEMEIEENNQRKEFTDEELMEGYKRLERLRNPSLLMKILKWLCDIFVRIGQFFKRLFSKITNKTKK